MSTAVSSVAISDLQSKWYTLHDLDRAAAVLALTKSGISVRGLADRLHLSESLLRRLLCALQALPEDRYLARKGKISTNELVRRSRAAGIRRSSMHREAQEFERAQAACQGCRTICDWLADEGISSSYGEQIVDETWRQIAMAEWTGKLPHHLVPPDMPAEEIIQRCKPPETAIEEFSFPAFYALWLARWAHCAFTDAWVRDTALDLALNEQFKR
jgi:lambda repressor-like predicted transcriptional regulator